MEREVIRQSCRKLHDEWYEYLRKQQEAWEQLKWCQEQCEHTHTHLDNFGHLICCDCQLLMKPGDKAWDIGETCTEGNCHDPNA